MSEDQSNRGPQDDEPETQNDEQEIDPTSEVEGTGESMQQEEVSEEASLGYQSGYEDFQQPNASGYSQGFDPLQEFGPLDQENQQPSEEQVEEQSYEEQQYEEQYQQPLEGEVEEQRYEQPYQKRYEQVDLGEQLAVYGDVKTSNVSLYVRAILGLAAVVIAIAIGAYFYMSGQKEMEIHKTAREMFDKAHKIGFAAFWREMDMNSDALNDVSGLDIKIMKQIKKDPADYSKRMKTAAINTLDASISEFQALKAPAAYADKLEAVVSSCKSLKDEVVDLTGQILLLGDFEDAERKFKRMNDAWFNAQTWKDEVYRIDAFKYYNLATCLLEGRNLVEIEPKNLKSEIAKTCEDRKGDWFRRAASSCFPALSAPDKEPDAGYNETIVAYRKKGEDKKAIKAGTGGIDETSLDAVKECAKDGQNEFERDLLSKLKAAIESYQNARKEFLAANNAALGG